ncbi:MAG: phage tail tape measure protein [Spirochaetota bacterium]
MKSLFTGINSFFLKNVDERNFVLYKKGQFLYIMDLIFIMLMLVLSFSALSAGHDRFLSIIKPSVPVVIAAITSILLVRSGRVISGANVMGIFACIIAIAGFMVRPVHIAGVSMGYFMFVDTAFATLFCSYLLSSLIITSFVAAHIIYYFVIALPTAEGIFAEVARTTMVDGVVTLLMVFSICMAIERFLNAAISKAESESGRNREQVKRIRSLMDTIRDTSQQLNLSIDNNVSVINQFSDNAQSQAATVEELSSTIEEISANAVNVGYVSKEQNQSIHDLIASIERMSASAEKMNSYGGELAAQFGSLIELTKTGEHASSSLEDINSKISENSGEILKVVEIIGQFFDQINLLSLNATIEAARAGEFGRGFAVVAEEIGKLSDNSSQELKQIAEIIGKNSNDVEQGSRIIADMIGFISTLLDSINRIQEQSTIAFSEIEALESIKGEMNSRTDVVKQKSEQIEISMNEQEKAMDDILQSIEQTNKAVQQNAQNTDVLRENADALKKLSVGLMEEFSQPGERGEE